MAGKKLQTVVAATAVPEIPNDVLLRMGQAAAILNCSIPTIHRLVNSGQVPHLRLGVTIRVPRSGLMRFIADRTTGGGDDTNV
jgi:excisionase family DNA binding protein